MGIQKETFDIKGRDRKCSCATMLIKVTEGNDTYNLDLEDNADVMELKALVWDVTGMRPRTQRLEFLGAELREGMLATLGIREGANVILTTQEMAEKEPDLGMAIFWEECETGQQNRRQE